MRSVGRSNGQFVTTSVEGKDSSVHAREPMHSWIGCVTGRAAHAANSASVHVHEVKSALEPVSPELVLVDPDFERGKRWAELTFERTRPRSAEDELVLRTVSEPSPRLANALPAERSRVRSRLGKGPSLVALGLFGIGLLGGLALVRSSGDAPRTVQGDSPRPITTPSTSAGESNRPQVDGDAEPLGAQAQRAASTAPGQQTARGQEATSVPNPGPASAGESTRTGHPRSVTVLGQTSATAEGRVLAALVRSPADKLPPSLIDAESGLVENNLQAVCRVVEPSSFACVVRRLHHRPGEGLRVRYRPTRDGRGVFTWGSYRER
jgi:hypothetical protein